MSDVGRTLRRLESNRHLVLDAIRVYVGAGLFFRGLALLVTDTGLQQLAGGATLSFAATAIAVYVTAAHLVGGALLAVGLYTRLAALVQLPILVGAVTLIHWQDGLLSANQSLEFSALVLFLLGLVALFGGGRWSLDARRGGSGAGEAASSDETANVA
jgi:putative oxidoreductase